ncbi:hypothetical protein TNCV_588881 [Trichonephila clavipes]|nr:hypothetical protein TNCV_588881 [Trichonephila clavipes]
MTVHETDVQLINGLQETKNSVKFICGAEAAAGVENGGEAVLVRRMNPRGGQLIRSKAQESNSLDQAENRLPPVDTMEACNKAAERLRELAHHLQHGEVPINVLQKALQYAACVLDTVCVDEASSPEQGSSDTKDPIPSKLSSSFLSLINILPRHLFFNSKRELRHLSRNLRQKVIFIDETRFSLFSLNLNILSSGEIYDSYPRRTVWQRRAYLTDEFLDNDDTGLHRLDCLARSPSLNLLNSLLDVLD